MGHGVVCEQLAFDSGVCRPETPRLFNAGLIFAAEPSKAPGNVHLLAPELEVPAPVPSCCRAHHLSRPQSWHRLGVCGASVGSPLFSTVLSCDEEMSCRLFGKRGHRLFALQIKYICRRSVAIIYYASLEMCSCAAATCKQFTLVCAVVCVPDGL